LISSPAGVPISEVTDRAALPDGFRVYHPMAGEMNRRSSTAPSPSPAGSDSGPANRCGTGVAHHEHRPVGAATSFVIGDTVLLVRCLVVPEFRRRGVGTALTRARLAAAAHDGARRAVLSPSPDGYHLHLALGFDLVASPRNRWFYLRPPVDSEGPRLKAQRPR